MRLRPKILSGFFILAVMLLIAGIWSIYELSAVGESVQNLLEENYKSINAAKTMLDALDRGDTAVLLLLMGRSEEGGTIMASADSLFEQGFRIASNNITIPGERANVDTIRSKYDNYKDLLLQSIRNSAGEGGLNLYFETMHSASEDVKAALNDLMSLNDAVMFRTASDLIHKTHRATMPGTVAIIAALVFSLIFTYFVNYYMITPIVGITNGIKKYVAKQQPFDVAVETEDEFADLANAIRTLCAHDEHAGTKQ